MGFSSRTTRKARSIVEWIVAGVLVVVLLLGLLVIAGALGFGPFASAAEPAAAAGAVSAVQVSTRKLRNRHR